MIGSDVASNAVVARSNAGEAKGIVPKHQSGPASSQIAQGFEHAASCLGPVDQTPQFGTSLCHGVRLAPSFWSFKAL